MTYFAFAMVEAFPEDDPLSEWLITLALAMNDLSLVHVHLEDDQDEPERALYWQRLAISHFTEAALFLHETREVPEVSAFIQSLDAQKRANYEQCLAVFEERRAQLFNTRNKATFHYPALRPGHPQEAGLVRNALAGMGEDRGIIRSGRLRDARALFADDVVAKILLNEVGNLEALPDFLARVAIGTTALIRFTNLALDEHLVRARGRGVAIDQVEPVDPGDLNAGWRPAAR